MKRLLVLAVLFLAACGGGEETPKVSRAQIAEPQGLTYEQFKSRTSDEGSLAAQKRFLLLDKDNNGRISDEEMGGILTHAVILSEAKDLRRLGYLDILRFAQDDRES